MTNVLPAQTQKKIRREHLARFTIAASLISLVVSFVAFLSLIPSEIALQIESRTLAAIEQSSPAAQEVAADRSALARTQSLVVTAQPYLATSTAALDAISAALSARPAGTTISSLSYLVGSKTISITGQGTGVNAYGAALRADKTFTAVQIPVGVLVGTDKRFTITLTGNF